jgi:ABC-type lipoprotein release transport system permease subunit
MDVPALAAACGVLAFAALAACLFPALRAARVAPAEALRAE